MLLFIGIFGTILTHICLVENLCSASNYYCNIPVSIFFVSTRYMKLWALVVLESPFSGDTDRNVRYLRVCLQCGNLKRSGC
jgi:hypothetical protein